MTGWMQSVAAVIGRWLFDWKMNREARTIARDIYPSLWENVRRKIPLANEAELAAYAKTRAAQLSHERIDRLMQAHPELPGSYGAQLLVKAADRATILVLAAVANATSSAA